MIGEGGAGAVRPWRVLREGGTASTLHEGAARLLEGAPVRTVRVCDPDGPALVLGSHQAESVFSRGALDANGIELARRRSGGTAVLVGSGRVLWVDFVIPRDDPLWDDDIGRAAWWVGELWASAIGAAEVWRGRLMTTEWSSIVCFAGLGPGEVTIGGKKAVGVCQRRTGQGALFQTAALLEWRPEEYAALVVRPPGEVRDLADSAAGLGRSVADRLTAALVDQLER